MRLLSENSVRSGQLGNLETTVQEKIRRCNFNGMDQPNLVGGYIGLLEAPN